MLRFFQRALDEPASMTALGIRLFTVPAPAVPVERLLAAEFAAPGPLLLWDSPALEPGNAPFAFVGWGEAARIEATGEARFDELRRGADALFATLTERRHPKLGDPKLGDVPAPRLFGGLAFRAEAERPAPWSDFRDASFTMPRWLYGTSGERAFLRLAVGAGERVDPSEIERTLAAVYAAAATPGEGFGERGSSAPRAASGARFERTSPADWDAMIVDALARIRARELEKVVPMVLCRVHADRDLDVRGALARVRAAYPDCSSFAFQRGSAIFLGASPERLVSRRGSAVLSDALAGSRARAPVTMGPQAAPNPGALQAPVTMGPQAAPNPGALQAPESIDDERAAQALLESDKDRREHRVVVLAIERALQPFVGAIRAPSVPRVRSLRNVHHLWTPIEATLTRPAHVLDLVRALHPTPAVCGTPQTAALAWIAAHEPTPRGWYAGAVGWFDAEGDGAFSVAIRSGVLDRREAWLYAGAGIVEGSDPGAEYAETRVKQTPLLEAIGLGS